MTKGEKWFKIIWHCDEAEHRNGFKCVNGSKWAVFGENILLHDEWEKIGKKVVDKHDKVW